MICSASPERRVRSVRSHWRWVWCALVATLLVVAVPAGAKGKKKKKNAEREVPSAEELFNPYLDLDHSHWLVGPIAHIATDEEIEAFLALRSDDEAKGFVEGFWARRNEGTAVFQDTPEEIFAARVAEADKRFSESAFPGSRTDRGMTWILYGPPETVTAEVPERVGDPAAELWRYPEGAAGLNGLAPESVYRFVKDGDLTVFLSEGLRRRIAARKRFERGRGGG